MQYNSKLTGLTFIIWVAIAIIISCENPSDRNKVTITDNSNTQETPVQAKISGENYSDSMAEAIINEITENSKPIRIDTFNDLHSFNKAMFWSKDCKKFSTEIISKLSTLSVPVTKVQSKLLGVTDYLCDKSFSDFFNTYIFYTKSNESHFSDAVELVNIENSSNKFRKLTLCQEYLSEGYEYKIESRFLSYNKIEISKTEKFNTSNTSKTDDSIQINRNIYFIDQGGKIEKIK